jgi:hypothetical protein
VKGVRVAQSILYQDLSILTEGVLDVQGI